MGSLDDFLDLLDLEDLGWLHGRALQRDRHPVARLLADAMAQRMRPDAESSGRPVHERRAGKGPGSPSTMPPSGREGELC